MRTNTEATRDLIEGGTIRLRPCPEGVTGRMVLLGIGTRALNLTGSTRGRVLKVAAVARRWLFP